MTGMSGKTPEVYTSGRKLLSKSYFKLFWPSKAGFRLILAMNGVNPKHDIPKTPKIATLSNSRSRTTIPQWN